MRLQIILFIALFPLVAKGQSTNLRLLPEVGLSSPLTEFKEINVYAKQGMQFGLHLDKMWGRFGLGLYGGLDINPAKFDDPLPASTPGLTISRSGEYVQGNWKQFKAGIGPIVSLDISKKFRLDLTSKLGIANTSYPNFSQAIDVGSPLNQSYILYETKNEAIDKKLNPLLLSAARLNFKISKRTDLSLSASYQHVRNVTHSYSYLDGGFNPEMSNEELISALQTAPTITEIRKCHFNTYGITLGLTFNISSPKDETPETIVTQPSDSCLSALIRNGEFTRGINRASGTAYWAIGYGSPKFLNTPGEGCFDPGFVEASGNQNSGDAIAQTLAAQNGIKLGRKYVLSVGVRFFDKFNTLDYARIRAIAYNGVLSTTGTHPAPGPDVAIIGRSGKIKDCGDWSIIEFPVWVANKDFSHIAIHVFTDDATSSTLWIDNVSMCEVGDGYDCEELQLDASNNPIMPSGYGNVPPGFTCQPEAEEEEYDNGSLSDLYGQLYGYDGTTNWYANATDKCFSLGGTLPKEVVNYNCDDSLKMLGINMTCEELENFLQQEYKPDTSTIPRDPYLPPLAVMTDACFLEPPPEYREMAFGGKDIIYIHGLQLDHLCDRANNVPGAHADWPFDQHEFYNGYYKTVAEANWGPHIDHFLRGKGNKNRYLIVTYNCSQRAEVAVHSVLAQIREAMETGKGVVADPSDLRGTACFAREYIFISHSTGAIVADAALTIANSTKILKQINQKYGDISLIADRCKGRVGLHGAYTGSSLATILVNTQQNPALSAIASAGLTEAVCSNVDLSIGVNRFMVLNSILVDLIPPISRAKWGPFIAAVPVPVLNVSGGHPSASVGPLKYIMHIGFDDGVVSMDCANTLINQPSNFTPNFIPKVFDMGIPRTRAIQYFLDQRLGYGQFGSSFTPNLSPTGMVQPVLAASPMLHAPNHYSFVQSASEHLQPKDVSYFSSCSYLETMFDGSRNYEEELVVSDPSLYSRGIVDHAIVGQMREKIRGEYIWYPTLIIKMVKGFPKPIVIWRKFYIWKRTYHTLGDDCLYDYDYVYKYLFKK